MNSQHIQHLYWRTGFGISPNQLQYLVGKNKIEIVDSIFNASKNTSVLNIDTSEFDDFNLIAFKKDKKIQKKFRDLSRQKIKDFNYAWITRLANPKELLRERMTLFWANHFVCDDKNIFHVQQYNNTLRKYALGNFKDFVKAISKEAAMIKYLNNKQNRKANPNENFARELMELFTLGMGNYTEKDIKESARAFTGYNHTFKGEFQLRQLQHDFGSKTFLGKTGNFNGDDIIDIILEQKQCAKFICKKVYRYFVNNTIVENHIDDMLTVFYPDYNIEKLMYFVFTSDWFYDDVNIGTKIKSPIEFLIGMQHLVPIKFQDQKDLLTIQALLGQLLLFPPNVAGWKGGTSWIDVNTIMVRLKLPSLLLNFSNISTKEKGDFNDSFRHYYFKKNSSKLPFKTEPNWNHFHKNYNSFSISTLENNLINGKFNKGTKAYLRTLNTSSKRDYCVQLMSLPEYQMC